MAKVPRAGRVKTRLGREIGMVRAAWWFRQQLRRLVRDLHDPRWELWLSVTPDAALGSLALPLGLPRMAQGSGDLGARMVRSLCPPGVGPVVVIGADIPGVRRAHVARAFRALGRRDFAFGPATDGGFWLVGAAHRRALPRGLFADCRWSSEHALADALATLGGQSHALADMMRDVDGAADLATARRANMLGGRHG